METLPLVAAATGTLAIVTRTAAEEIAAITAIKILEIEDGTATHDIRMFWSEVHRRDDHHRWLRNLVVEELCGEKPILAGSEPEVRRLRVEPCGPSSY